MPILYLASRNQHKIEEIQQMLGSLWRIRSSQQLDPNLEWDESGLTFEANALIKAQALRTITQESIIADDSGLEVDSLRGQPGVFSARYAGVHATDEENRRKLLKDLSGVPRTERQARFICMICYLDAAHKAHFFEGRCEGRILEQAEGSGGFGYDSIFAPEGYQQSFASLHALEKNKISHRYRAIKALQEFLAKV